MKPKEFLNAVDLVVKEKGIDKEVIFDAMELALTSAYKKNYNAPNVRVSINKDTGDIRVCSFLNVVEEIDEEDEGTQILLEDARKIVPEINVGETIEEEVEVRDFGRVAAATAKQVVIQKVPIYITW